MCIRMNSSKYNALCIKTSGKVRVRVRVRVRVCSKTVIICLYMTFPLAAVCFHQDISTEQFPSKKTKTVEFDYCLNLLNFSRLLRRTLFGGTERQILN